MNDKGGTAIDVKPIVYPLKDGGPAFPAKVWGQSHSDGLKHDGMSLRDWFAGQIVGTLLAHIPEAPNRTIARQAYALADEMIAAREAT